MTPPSEAADDHRRRDEWRDGSLPEGNMSMSVNELAAGTYIQQRLDSTGWVKVVSSATQNPSTLRMGPYFFPL